MHATGIRGNDSPNPIAPLRGIHREDDDLLAAVFIRMWALASGRSLPRDVPPDELTPEELIAFWADDFSTVSGRHSSGTSGNAR